ncbi:MAG TPA: DUF6766 family protein [Actinomycetota bacterium]|nr:DUF6766 family protein [Actinomycetota bacterium]
MSTALLVISLVITVGAAAYLVGALVYSIRQERARKIWKNFGLSISLATLFFATWLAQGLIQWRVFISEQRQHGERVEAGEFVSEFLQSTLENWQSEFLQLFSFVVLAAVLIHKGSAESKDSDDEIQAALARIERRLEGRSRKR